MRSANTVPAARPEQTVIPFRNGKGRRAEEVAFLPAALEITETPPSPIGRAIALALMLLVCAALAWSAWGTIDIVTSATGKVVSSGRSKVIQPFETGVVRAIHVQDGQSVKAGDLLIELDPTVNAAERDRLHDDLMAERLNVARLRAALAGGEGVSADLVVPEDADPMLVATQRQLLANQVSENRAKLGGAGTSGSAEGGRTSDDCGDDSQA
ncbi:multidrug efflux pump subunit AcrA (membrane-fusion protein) [Bradyrhizobium sp. GM22.5]